MAFAGLKIGPFQEVSLPLVVGTGRSAGPIREMIAFEANEGWKKQHVIPVNGYVDKHLNLEREVINFGLISQAAQSKRVPIIFEENVSPDIALSISSCDSPLAAEIVRSSGEAFLMLKVDGFKVGTPRCS